MVGNQENLNNKEDSEKEMSLLSILSDRRTNFLTKLKRLILRIDVIFIILIIFAGIFFYLGSKVGWIFVGIAVLEYLVKSD